MPDKTSKWQALKRNIEVYQLKHLRRLHQEGFSPVLAGGYLRDTYCNRTPRDVDIFLLGTVPASVIPGILEGHHGTQQEFREQILKYRDRIQQALGCDPNFRGIDNEAAFYFHDQTTSHGKCYHRIKVFHSPFDIDIVLCPEKTAMDLISNFDFGVNQIAYDFETKKLIVHDNFKRDMIRGVVGLNDPSLNPKITRMQKIADRIGLGYVVPNPETDEILTDLRYRVPFVRERIKSGELTREKLEDFNNQLRDDDGVDNTLHPITRGIGAAADGPRPAGMRIHVEPVPYPGMVHRRMPINHAADDLIDDVDDEEEVFDQEAFPAENPNQGLQGPQPQNPDPAGDNYNPGPQEPRLDQAPEWADVNHEELRRAFERLRQHPIQYNGREYYYNAVPNPERLEQHRQRNEFIANVFNDLYRREGDAVALDDEQNTRDRIRALENMRLRSAPQELELRTLHRRLEQQRLTVEQHRRNLQRQRRDPE